MANQLYGFNYSSYGGEAASNMSGSGKYFPRSVTDSYFSSDPSVLGSSRYLGSSETLSSSSMLFNVTDSYSAASSKIPGLSVASPPTSHLAPHVARSGPPGVDVGVGPASAVTDLYAGLKRPGSDAIYHQTIMGAHNMIGQNEALFPTNPLVKRPRLVSACNLPIYPQRPGMKDCAHYMLTRTCKYGDSCKFDHPIWVPEGGIPDWKEVPLVTTEESLPERPGEPDCPYFLKTQGCKFGSRCKFNHPKDSMPMVTQENINSAKLPERPSELPCAFYMKTGKCKFGITCKFHHPKDLLVLCAEEENSNVEDARLDGCKSAEDWKISKPLFTPALLHNSKGLPIRPGEVDCPFYLKTGSCKFGATCRYNHPERNKINPPAAAIDTSTAQQVNVGLLPASSILQTFDPRISQTTSQLGLGPVLYPQRPGEIECDFYMKTGECKFGQRCKFHHPFDRSAPSVTGKDVQRQNVKLSLAGLPRREGAIHCPYYMKTGTCKYGATCKFDHPPPGEVMAVATLQETRASTGEDGKEDGKEVETGN